MGNVVGVKFRDQGQVYYFDAQPYVVHLEESVLVKTDEGVGLGRVVDLRTSLPAGMVEKNLKPIFRLATEEDLREQKENKLLEKEAFTHCRECITLHSLEMKLVDVEVYFDRSKMVFYFTAPGRIDFRELVKDLVRAYRTRIELRQIGVRHETQMLGALGNCGQVCCCRRFLRKFEPVTIKMAKDQNLFLNPAKISGVCGRLLCCLAYEKDTYIDFQRRIPKMGKKFNTSLGTMRTLRSNMFHDSIIVLTEDNEEREVSLDEWQEIVSFQRKEWSQKVIGGKPREEDELPADSPQGGGALEADRSERPRSGQARGKKPRPQGRPQRAKDARGKEQGRDFVKKKKSSSPAGQTGGKKQRNEASRSKGGEVPATGDAQKKSDLPSQKNTPQTNDAGQKGDAPKGTAGKRRRPSNRRRSRKKPGPKKAPAKDS